MSYTLNRPVPFPGTLEEAAANQATHAFYYCGDEDYLDAHCTYCDAKPWHAAASYPCGTDVPREVVVIRTPDDEQVD